jgi:hypothetical protein
MRLYIRNLLGSLSWAVTPIFIFAASRLILFGVVALMHAYPFVPILNWNAWDANSYLDIAQNGYRYAGYGAATNTIAFFPLYPLLVRGFHLATQLSFIWSALGISFIFGCVASSGIYRLAEEFAGKQAASMAVFLFSFYPVSIFLSVPYAETLLVSGIVWGLVFLQKERWYAAAFCIGAAMVTKIIGIILLPLLVFRMFKSRRPMREIALIFCIAIIPFLFFLLAQYTQFYDPFAFFKAQHVGWGKYLASPMAGIRYMIGIIPTSYGPYHIYWLLEMINFMLATLTYIFSFKSLNGNLRWFCGVLLLVCVSTNLPLSISRFLLSYFVYYLIWGKWLSKAPLAIQQLAIAGLACLMAVFAAAYFDYYQLV